MNVNPERGLKIMTLLGMNGADLQKRLEAIAERVLQDKEQILKSYSSWENQIDARITSLNNLFLFLECTRMSIEFLGELSDDDWFLGHSPTSPLELRDQLAMSYQGMVKYNFGMNIFIGIENSFRSFLKILDPVACNNCTAPFINIYNHLLGPKQLNLPEIERAAALDLLNLIRLLRNLIHSNGIYVSSDGKDESTRYKGRTFTFKNGKPVNFVTWVLLLEIADDVRKLMVNVINLPVIASITHAPDPHAENSN